jgi:hypothetical protein
MSEAAPTHGILTHEGQFLPATSQTWLELLDRFLLDEGNSDKGLLLFRDGCWLRCFEGRLAETMDIMPVVIGRSGYDSPADYPKTPCTPEQWAYIRQWYKGQGQPVPSHFQEIPGQG